MKPDGDHVLSSTSAAWGVVGREGDVVTLVLLDAESRETHRSQLDPELLGDALAAAEHAHPGIRIVWSDTPAWYAPILDTGGRVSRCHDLRLCHAILRDSALVGRDAEGLRAAAEWEASRVVETTTSDDALFALDGELLDPDRRSGPPDAIDAALAEFDRQLRAIAGASDPARLRVLCSAESAGALIAVELRHAGLPWDAEAHDRVLVSILGPRTGPTGRPAELDRLADEVRTALGDPAASLDSQPKLLRALHRVGIMVQSTSRWELREHSHPVVAPLIEYKRLLRLYQANGWHWLDEWVHDGRFRPVYVPAGVVTGRWASSGGGALQIPRQLRMAVRADPGWVLVVADVAQLEPRVLAAMSRDTVLAEAARGRDLYEGIVESGAVGTRAEAKVALLGAMYGATTGDSGRLVPRLRRAYPRAMALVDDAARAGEEGGVVSTWLGRTSPPPSAAWRAAQSKAADVEASAADETRARRWGRDRGRFTRNFVVQGTAAEWALAWLGDLRMRLRTFPVVDAAEGAPRSGPAFSRQAHLAFFLHDELIVHAPAAHADEVADAVTASAVAAGVLLFGGFPIEFPLDLRIAQTAEKA